jgi:DNA-binding XRE family transcriptional regulator
VRFRHLDYPNDTAARELGPAAIDALLERGDLHDWRALAREVARDPWGDLSNRILQISDAHQMYGTSALWKHWIARRRERSDAPLTLAGARKRVGLTQAEVARRMGISQADVSRIERRSDVRLSTLRSYFSALGADLRISANLPGEDGERSVMLAPARTTTIRPARSGAT